MVASSSERAYTLLHVSDTHLHATVDSRMRGVRTHETFLAVLDQARRDHRWPPAAILATGDIVQDESRAGYLRFRDTLAPFGVPVLTTPGNHDDPNLMSELLTTTPFQFCGERRLGGWSLILLNTFLAGEDAGGLGPARLNGLRKALAAHPGQHVLIAMHHHPLPMASRWLDGVGLRDAAEFLGVIDKHPQVRAVVFGHVHQASDRERNGTWHLSTPSTCAQFLPCSDSFALDDKPPGWRWLTLSPNGAITTAVAWAGA